MCAVVLPAAAACSNSGACVVVMLPDGPYAWPGTENAISFFKLNYFIFIKLFYFHYK